MSHFEKDSTENFGDQETSANDVRQYLSLLSAIGNAESEVRSQIAQSETTPEDILRLLSEDWNDEVRESVALNPKATADILKRLAEDESSDVRRAVTQADNATVDILAKLSEDPDWTVRLFVAINPKTPKRIFDRLLKDGELNDRRCFEWTDGTQEGIADHVFTKMNRALESLQ